MKIIKKIISIFTILSVLNMAISYTAFASEEKSDVNFGVKAIKSDKQVDKTVSYFDLMLEPGETHEIAVEILNNAPEPLEVSISANTAGTNTGGVIDYIDTNVTDDSLKIAFSDIAKVSAPTTVIDGNSSKIIEINIDMPDETFDGVLLGGISIIKTNSQEASAAEGASIKNNYCYVIGVKIRQNDVVVEPELRLRYAEPQLINYKATVVANLQNFMPAIVKGMNIQADVFKENSQTPLFSKNKDLIDMAPNSNFNFNIDSPTNLVPGNYKLVMTVSLDEKQWGFEENYHISATQADGINSNAINTNAAARNNQIRMRYFIMFGALLIVLLIIFFIIMDRRRNKRNLKVS